MNPRLPDGRLSRFYRGAKWLRHHAYLGAIAAGVLLLTQSVELTAPEKVRVDPNQKVALIGEVPEHEFSEEMNSPQTVQMRATLRLFDRHDVEIGRPDPASDLHAQLLSQPVVTTILGMNARIEQTVRLEKGDLEIDVTIDGTPRLEHKKSGRRVPGLMLSHDVHIESRRKTFFSRGEQKRVHLSSHGILAKVEEEGYRLVFLVDQHLFSLDIELHRAI